MDDEMGMRGRMKKFKWILTLWTVFLFFEGPHSSAWGETIKVGPELEVQAHYVKKFLDAVDWPVAELRWGALMKSIRVENNPHIVSLFHMVFGRTLQGETLLFDDEVTQKLIRERGDDLIKSARNDPRLALKITEFSEVVRKEYLQPNFLPEGVAPSAFSDFSRLGIYRLKGDTHQEYRIHQDHDVFEITRFPPSDGVSSTQAWTEKVRSLLSIPSEALPGQSLNPHFHMSRYIRNDSGAQELEALNSELRVLTALFTIEAADPARPMKPFFGGKNSANALWEDGELVPAAFQRGNVRLIPSETVQGITELRQEFRSLGNVPWAKIYPFLNEIEVAFQGSSIKSVRKSVRMLLSNHFERVSPRKLAEAIKLSRELNSVMKKTDSVKYRAVDEYLGLFKSKIRESLVEARGEKSALRLHQEKWSEIDSLLGKGINLHPCDGALKGVIIKPASST